MSAGYVAPVLLLWFTMSRAEAPTFAAWVSRGDTAAANLTIAAKALADTADAVGREGRAQRFAELHTLAEEVVRRARLLETTIAPEPGP